MKVVTESDSVEVEDKLLRFISPNEEFIQRSGTCVAALSHGFTCDSCERRINCHYAEVTAADGTEGAAAVTAVVVVEGAPPPGQRPCRPPGCPGPRRRRPRLLGRGETPPPRRRPGPAGSQPPPVSAVRGTAGALLASSVMLVWGPRGDRSDVMRLVG